VISLTNQILEPRRFQREDRIQELPPRRALSEGRCFNRRDLTLAALGALFELELPPETCLGVILVDDGSTDGTGDEVRRQFPQVRVIQGTGSHYWNGGMRVAFRQAELEDYDYHLWLNQDTILSKDALVRLLQTSGELAAAGFEAAIVSGSTQDADTGGLTSSGFRFKWHKRLMSFEMMAPRAEAQPCDTVPGNCLLVPREVFGVLGNLSPAYTHSLGDVDYGLRAHRCGFSTWIAPGVVATSPLNQRPIAEVDAALALREIKRRLGGPKGLALGDGYRRQLMPAGEWIAFLREHAGPWWWIPWILTYAKLGPALVSRWRRRIARAA
jgi:glycosyltransferase involved in cell wall biosynthesis